MNKSNSLKLLLALFDFLLLLLAYYAIAKPGLMKLTFLLDGELIYFVIASLTSWLLAASFFGVYSADSISDYESYNRNTLRAYLLYALGFSFILFFVFHTVVSRQWTMVLILDTALGLVISRLCHLIVLNYYRKTKRLARRVAILGSVRNNPKFVEYLRGKPQFYDIVGVISDKDDGVDVLGASLVSLGSEQNLIDICTKKNISEVYCIGLPNENPVVIDLYPKAELSFIKMKFVPNFDGFVQHQTSIDFFGPFPILSLRTEPLELRYNQMKKRVFDIIFSVLVIFLVFTWLFPVIGLLIKLGSRGPIFFVQKRSGKNNQTFECVKFRSMKVNEDANLKQATENDDRLTALGKFMRKTNIDELPQFFNVLIGNMSVVGPRPHMLKHTEQYSKLISQYMLRHWLKPGITGWAQVNGYRGETKEVDDMVKRVEYDIWYGENWNFYFDLRIICKTVFNTMNGDKKAY
jgi:putative colanic acid biosysnthesis UDP-glucose lipid carrier transferase